MINNHNKIKKTINHDRERNGISIKYAITRNKKNLDICPHCKKKLFFIVYGFLKKNSNIIKQLQDNKVRYVIGGCCITDADYECLECGRYFTYDLKELYEKSDKEETIKLSKNEILSVLKNRNIGKTNMSYNDFIKKIELNLKKNNIHYNNKKSMLAINILSIKGDYIEDFYNVTCPKCNGNIIAKNIYTSSINNVSLYKVEDNAYSQYLPEFSCLHCGHKFNYELNNIQEEV